MSASAKVKEELRAVGLYTLYFGAWFSAFVLLKVLILEEYQIRFAGLSAVFVGALVLAKVVLLLEEAFEVRHEYGGMLRALADILRHEDIPHVVANAIVATSALLVFNVFSLVRKRLGSGALLDLLRAPAGKVD